MKYKKADIKKKYRYIVKPIKVVSYKQKHHTKFKHKCSLPSENSPKRPKPSKLTKINIKRIKHQGMKGLK